MDRTLRVLSFDACKVERSLSRVVGAAAHRTDARCSVQLRVECFSEQRMWIGSGEASPLPGYSLDDLVDVDTALASLQAQLPWTLPLDADILHNIEHRCASLPPATRAAVETALLDIVGQIERRPLWSLLAGREVAPHMLPLSSQLLGSIEQLGDEARRLVQLGYHTLKRKLDASDAAAELVALATLQGVSLRLDANASLSCDALRALRPAIDRLRPVLFEEPLSDDLARRLEEDEPALRGLPLAIDESLRAATATEALARLERFLPFVRETRVIAIVVKPMRDGLFGALRLAQAAQAAGAQAIVTHCWEGAVGQLAAAHLGWALHRTDGLAHAPTLPPTLVSDEATPAQSVLVSALHAGTLVLSRRAGLGTAEPHA